MKRLQITGLAALAIALILCLNPFKGTNEKTVLSDSPETSFSPTPTVQPTPTPDPSAQSEEQEGPSESEEELLVVIDAGHGGHDPGTNRGDVFEKDIVLDIALRLDSLLKEQGVSTLLTRSDDTFLKLEERIRIANEKNAALFLSIHVDSFESDSSVHGTTVHYFHSENLKTGNLTETMYVDILRREFNKVCSTKDRGIKKSDYAVLRLAKVPAALIELGFITNDNDLKLLTSEEFRQKAAQGLANGIVEALKHVNEN